MLIYRVESEEGDLGPFTGECGDGSFPFKFDRVKGTESHPVPENDGLGKDVVEWNDWHCGCVSMDQLRYWFSDFIKELDDMGMTVKVFDVPDEDCRVGRNQVAFLRSDDKIMETMSLEALLKP